MKKWILSVLFITSPLLIGSAVLEASTTTEQEIGHLLRFIASSECIFIRNGSQYPAGNASTHIERKYHYVKTRIKTTEDFITLTASESSFSGNPYQVNCAGKESLSKAWLLEELSRYRQAKSVLPGNVP